MRKLFLQNVGYFRGINGSLTDIAMKWPRFFYISPAEQRAAMNEFNAVVERERPDTVFLTEIHQGSLDNAFLNQVAEIAPKYSYGKAFVRYDPNTPYERWWFFRGKSNAYFGETPRSVEHFYLSRGTKRLVMTVRFEDFRVYLVHLATLSAPMRARQMMELARTVSKAGSTIICGDFNIFDGTEELAPLLTAGFVLVGGAPTFPASNPRHPLDLFLVSPDLAPRVRVRVIEGTRYSDHAPVVLEVDGGGTLSTTA